ncbi:MAG: AAA family ATPase, partial [Chloroflexi bacterium]|nr:AAA family ATPase [Chloroflexota bacterium]
MDHAPLLATKLMAPTRRPDAVVRPHLLDRLHAGLRAGRRLSLVSAPPGFGKTTVVADWLAATDRRRAWLALDEGDNDAWTFVRYLAAALDQSAANQNVALRTQAGGAPAEGIPAAQASPERAATGGSPATQAPAGDGLVALINGLAAANEPWLLVLDDYQAIRSFAVHDLVTALLAHGPPGLHIAIATREDPPLPLARLRARDELTEIRQADLRFAPGEATAFFRDTMGLGLAPAASAALAERTEGWITGLQLAGLALRRPDGSGNDPRAVDAFVGA